jgi:uncharacterized membrane protein (DUF485 family)
MVDPQAIPTPSSDQQSRRNAGQDDPGRFYPLHHHQLRHWIAIPSGILLILIAAAALAYGFFTTWSAVEQHGRAVVLKTLPLPLLIFILTAILALVILIRTARHWNDGITLNTTGLTLRKGKTEKTLPWASITRLNALVNVVKFATSVVDVRTRATFEDDQGQSIVITDRFADAQDLVQRCRAKVLPRLYRQTQRALQQGEKVTFHRDLAANNRVVLIRNMPYEWEAVGVVMKRRKITLIEKSTQRDLITLPIRKLANTDILMALFENPPR